MLSSSAIEGTWMPNQPVSEAVGSVGLQVVDDIDNHAR